MKKYINQLLELVKEFGYWSSEVSEFNNVLLSTIGYSKYYQVQNKILALIKE